MLTVQLFAVITALVGSTTALTTNQEAAVRDICIDLITDQNTGLNLIAGFVRLIFHDCVGGCDGCINLNLIDPTGDRANAGLLRYIDVLEARYANAQTAGITSRADYWALCAAEAVRQGRGQVGRAPDLVVSVKYGRNDCSSSPPYTNNRDNRLRFPNPRLGLSHVLTWCDTTFGFNSKECVALMGAHTLGRALRGNSGYTGTWVSRENALDNGFFTELLNTNWTQENVARPRQSPRWQYVRDPDGDGNATDLVMLNTDMCLLKNLTIDPVTGRGPATVDDVPDSFTADDVRAYAKDDDTWALDFGNVFGRMIEQGNSNLQRATGTPVALPPPVRRGGGRGGGGGGGNSK